MSTHKRIYELLTAFALDELPAQKATQVKTHLADCSQCRLELKRLKTLLEHTNQIKAISADEQLCASTKQSLFATITNEKQKLTNGQPNIWRTIMKSKITKLTTAAMLTIAITAGLITILTNGATPAYAIEQSIEAMRYIESIHAYCTDWDGSQGQTWVQVDPETGQEEYYHSDRGNLLIVGTPQATYYYYKDENLVRIRNEYVPASDLQISRFFESLVSWVQKYHGELSFNSQFDEDLQKEVIMVHASVPKQPDMQEQEYIIRVDYRTKLPISLEALKNAPGQGVKSVDRLEYNVPIPEGIFKFEIPEGAEVIDERKTD